MLKDHGKVMTLNKRGSATYDAITGKSDFSTAAHSVLGFFYNNAPQSMEVGDTSFGSRRLVLKATKVDGQPTPEPEIQDLLSTVGQDDAAVTKVSTLRSKDKVLCFVVYLEE